MSTADEWLNEYAEIRAFAPTRTTDWIAIPLLVTSLIGLLWSIPVPQEFSRSSPVLNWGTLFLMATVVYYFILSMSLAIGSLPFVVGIAVAAARLDALSTPLWLTSGSLFAIVATWQLLVEYHGTRRPPRVFKHVQFVMIAPLWLLASLYRRLGIPY